MYGEVERSDRSRLHDLTAIRVWPPLLWRDARKKRIRTGEPLARAQESQIAQMETIAKGDCA